MKLNKNFFKENIKTIIYALLIAIFIRSIFFQPFYIPSSSMEPALLVGDRLFVSKYTYGYSKHSFPFSPNISNNRFFFKEPKRGDVVVFKTPTDNRTDYIKRLIGLPGDIIQFIDGDLYLNDNQILKTKNKTAFFSKRFAAKEAFSKALGTGFRETLNFKDISIINNKYGKPSIKIKDKLQNIIKKQFKTNKVNILLSISDENKYSIAFVILEKNEIK